MVPVRSITGNDGVVRNFEIPYFSTTNASKPSQEVQEEDSEAGVKRLNNPNFEDTPNTLVNPIVAPQATEVVGEPPANAIPAGTPRRKKTAKERVRDELAIDGTALFKREVSSASKDGIEVYRHSGAWWLVEGTEPEEWTTNKKKTSTPKATFVRFVDSQQSGANGINAADEFDTVSQRGRMRQKAGKTRKK